MTEQRRGTHGGVTSVVIRALTLRQPWAWAIAHCDKRVENRTWSPPHSLVGGYIAIHAGLTVDREAIEDFNVELTDEERGRVVLSAADMARGAIVAVARLARVQRYAEFEVAREARVDRWLCGPVAWYLDRVVTIVPMPCRGAQGLWQLEPERLIELRRLFKEARTG